MLWFFPSPFLLLFPFPFPFSFSFCTPWGGRSPISQIFLPRPVSDRSGLERDCVRSESRARYGARSAVRFRTRLDRSTGDRFRMGPVGFQTRPRHGLVRNPTPALQARSSCRGGGCCFSSIGYRPVSPAGFRWARSRRAGRPHTGAGVPSSRLPQTTCSGRKRFGGRILCGGVHWNFGKVTLKRKTRISGLAFHPPGTFEPTCW